MPTRARSLLPVISSGFADSNYLRQAWGTVAHGFWPYRTTPVEVYETGFHNVDERIHTDDLAYGVRRCCTSCATMLA